MAIDYKTALQKALSQQASTGAKGPIDEAYVKTLMIGDDAGYTQGIVDANKPNPIVSAITNSQTTPTVEKQKTNTLTDMMNQQSKAQTDSILSQIRQRIAESKANQEKLITGANEQYQPLRNQSEVAKSQQLRSVLEQSANMGDRGGIGRQEALTTQTEGENRLNQINMQQQNFVDSANSEIARLENEGRYQEAQAVYDQKSRDLQNAIEEARRQEDIQRSDLQRQDAQSREDFGASIGANFGDLQAYANQLRQQGAPEWQINQVLSARQGKLSDIAKGQSEQQNALYKMAMDKWESGIPVNSQEANALGVRVGSVKPVKSSSGSSETVKPVSNDFAVDGIEQIMKRYEPAKGIAGALQKAFPSGAMQQEIQNYFQQLADSGYPERELRLLAARYGIQLGGSAPIEDSSTRMTN